MGRGISRPGASRTARVQPNQQTPPGPIGNTNGLVVPQTEANPHGNSAPPIKPTEKEKGWWQRWGSDVVHIGLDVVGLIPGVGEIADGANALIYLAEGDKVNAALSTASMLPFGGQAATAAKWGKRGAEAAAEAAAKAGKAEQKAGTRAAKEGAEEAAEAGGKGGKGDKGSGGGKDKGKKKLKCGEGGSFGNLKKKTGDGKFDRDHIPSKAALKKRAEQLRGKSLTEAQKRAIDNQADAIAIPRQAHIDASPTYGQSPTAAAKDAQDLAGSAKRDVDAMLEKIDDYDEDGKCRKAYEAAAQKVLKKTNADFDKMLLDLLKEIK